MVLVTQDLEKSKIINEKGDNKHKQTNSKSLMKR